MDGAAHKSTSSLPGIMAQLVRAKTNDNARRWGVLRFAMFLAIALIATAYAFAEDQAFLKSYLPLYYAISLITGVGCVLVFRSDWVRQRQFLLLPLLDIPVLTVERWFYLTNSPRPESGALLCVILLLLIVVLAQFSLNRRLVVATTAAALLSAGIILFRTGTLSVFVGISEIALALAGAGAWLIVGQALELLSTVAARSDELRLLLSHLETAREEERSRLSHNLHDELGQELSALSFALAYTLRRASSEPSAIQQNLGELDRLLTQTKQTVRGIVTDLRPRILDELGFRAAVEWLVQRTRQRGLRCELTFEGEHPVDDRLAIATFRVLQEALTNAVRHAQAKQVTIRLALSPDELTLRVTDDGVGFVQAAIEQARSRGGGMGLIGMRERAEDLGGELTVSQRSGAGTEVRLQVRAAKG